MNRYLTAGSLVAFLVVFLGYTPEWGNSSAYAQNPESARFRMRVARQIRGEERRPDLVTVSATHIFDVPIEQGGECQVTLFACVQRFVPVDLNPDPDPRNCDSTQIATVVLSEGEQSVRFRLGSAALLPGRRLRQVSFQTSSACTDSSDLEETVVSNPRARVVTGERGVSVDKFLRRLRKRVSATVVDVAG